MEESEFLQLRKGSRLRLTREIERTFDKKLKVYPVGVELTFVGKISHENSPTMVESEGKSFAVACWQVELLDQPKEHVDELTPAEAYVG